MYSVCLSQGLADTHIAVQHGGQQHVFEAPSGFSVAFKQLQRPALVSDNGWKSVRYLGRELREIRDAHKRGLRSGGVNSFHVDAACQSMRH